MHFNEEEKKFLKTGVEMGYFSGKATIDEFAEKVEKPSNYVAERIQQIAGKALDIDKEYQSHKQRVDDLFVKFDEISETSFNKIREIGKKYKY